MIENIRTSFIDMIDDSNWMDATSKRKAIEKVNIDEIVFTFENDLYFLLQ
jgi:hypothetical protein